ncbi:MAG TPA: hypothetical protein VMN37_02750 [Gemmatimonadales bacterium]|nr:hypothetical protein [Gemmatimonadales bacterium]
MPPRIVFNGREYASPEAMPEDVRKAYGEALAMLRDANADGIPDVLEAGGADTVIGVRQSSLTWNGRTVEMENLPAAVRPLVKYAMDQAGASSAASPEPSGTEISSAMGAAHGTLGVLLTFLAGFAVVFGAGLILAIGGGRAHLPGRLAVAVGALLFLGWLDRQATNLARRRRPLLAPDPPSYRRFVVWSAVGLFLSAVLLLGLAWFLP